MNIVGPCISLALRERASAHFWHTFGTLKADRVRLQVQAMGREVGAMCHHNRRRMEQKAPAPPPPPPGYWACTAALQEVCPPRPIWEVFLANAVK